MSWYNPKHAKQVWPKGEYKATIVAATPEESKSGNSMFKLTVVAYDGEKKQQLYDYLVAGEASTWKIEAFASAFNATEEFKNGTFNPEDYVGRNVYVQLTVEKSEEYGDKNRIARYVRDSEAGTKPSAGSAGAPAISEADIPF